MSGKRRWASAFAQGSSLLPSLIELLCVGGQTFHLEAEMPEGMGVASSLVGFTTTDGTPLSDSKAPGRRIHLYVPGVEQARFGVAILSLRLQRAGFMGNALAACAAVTVVLLASVLAAPKLASANATVPTLMLFFPGLLATIVLQPTAHALTRRLLREARRAVFLCAIFAYLAAMWLVVAPAEPGKARDGAGAGHAVLVQGPAAPQAQVERDPEASSAEVPSVDGLRIGWGVLAALATMVTISTGVVYRRALQ